MKYFCFNQSEHSCSIPNIIFCYLYYVPTNARHYPLQQPPTLVAPPSAPSVELRRRFRRISHSIADEFRSPVLHRRILSVNCDQVSESEMLSLARHAAVLPQFGGYNRLSKSCDARSRMMTVNGPRTCSFSCFSRRCTSLSIHRSVLQKDLNTSCLGKPLNCHYRSLRHIVRSDIVNDGTAEAVDPVSEVDLTSKARGICFYMVTAVLAICCIGPMLVAHPFVLIADPYRRGFQHLVARTWSTLTILPFIKVEYEGLENLPTPDTPAVYVSNHQSFLDIYTLLTLRSNFKFISKTSIFLYPIIGWAMLLLGVIPLKRMDTRSQLECLKRCMDLINRGASVFFFPEGTRSKDGRLGTFKVQ